MRLPVLLAACSMALAVPASAGPLHPLSARDLAQHEDELLPAKVSRAFTRCMRERYGPHYYRGVKRAHRYFMAQACGG